MATFTISNAAGGSERNFRLIRGHLSAAAIRHAHACSACGGPVFGGDAAKQAHQAWDAWWDDYLSGAYPEWEKQFQGWAA